MEYSRYTSNFGEIKFESLSSALRVAISSLRKQPDVTEVYRIARGYKRNGKSAILVGANVQIAPYLPARWNPRREGMLAVEPVVFIFDEERYPYNAPQVGSDRIGFTWKGKPHISQPTKNWPPLFCLARIPLDDWFAVHGFQAFFDRVVEWLFDAAQGNLQRANGRFEPTLLPYEFHCVFDYQRTETWINNQRGLARKPDFSYAEFKLPHSGTNYSNQNPRRYLIRFDGPASKKIAGLYASKFQGDEEGRALGGFAAWVPSDTCVDEHFTVLPATHEGLLEWGKNLEIPIEEPLNTLIKASDPSKGLLIPMLIGVQRPNLLFGVESNFEILPLLYWRYDAKDIETILFARHQHLHTTDRAQQLSNTTALRTSVTLVGAGALGSKLFEHWYRGGQTKWTLIDSDVLAPHNLTRHILGANHQGQPKVQGIREDVEGMYDDTENIAIEALTKDLADVLADSELRSKIDRSFVVDATASPAALQELTADDFPAIAGAARCSIVDEGRKGTVLLEGQSRNPRLDDVQAYLYQLGLSEDNISEWLAHRANHVDQSVGVYGEEIEIGLGCASDTLRLSDDEISLHTAQLSLHLRHWLGAHGGPAVISRNDRTNGSGTSIDMEVGQPQRGRIGLSDARHGWSEWEVPPVDISETGDWQVRVSSVASKEMERLMHEQAPNETGGILLGQLDHNRRIIYVTQARSAPPDSTCSPTVFVRGTKGVRHTHSRAARRTGGIIGYIGEWHSHPAGPRSLSEQDLAVAQRTRRRFQGSPFPALIIVIAPSGILSHVEPAHREKEGRKA